MCDLHEKLDDGIYLVVFAGAGECRCEKINGKWFISDGTGWKQDLEYPEAIISAKDISDVPLLKKTMVYDNTYPLTDFFLKT